MKLQGYYKYTLLILLINSLYGFSQSSSYSCYVWGIDNNYVSRTVNTVSTTNNGKTIIVNYLEKKYTPVVIDLMDTFNQYKSYDPEEYANDNVSSYSLAQIEEALKGAKTLEEWRDNLKNLYDNPTESNLDELFKHIIQ
jgi:hypothetical protein